MRINNTQNSPDFKSRFFVVSTPKNMIQEAQKFAKLRSLIKDGCKKIGIPCEVIGGDIVINAEGKQVFRMPFVTGHNDVAQFKSEGGDDLVAFVPAKNTLELNSCIKAIQNGRFDFENGVILDGSSSSKIADLASKALTNLGAILRKLFSAN